MIDLKSSISAIEKLLSEKSDASLTYAALECRLAIERICYERLRLAHDYISHADLKKWQPRDIVKTLIQEVDSKAASTFTLSISKEPLPKDLSDPTLEQYQAMEFIPVGTQVGFDPNKLGRLWNGLANVALHVRVPVRKDDLVSHYGDSEKIEDKVLEALREIRRISEGTLISSMGGDEVYFNCSCGIKNRRRIDLLKDKQIVNCINIECDESYFYSSNDQSFSTRKFDIICKKCERRREIPKRMVEKLKWDQHVYFDCEGCQDRIFVQWRPMQAQRSHRIDEA